VSNDSDAVAPISAQAGKHAAKRAAKATAKAAVSAEAQAVGGAAMVSAEAQAVDGAATDDELPGVAVPDDVGASVTCKLCGNISPFDSARVHKKSEGSWRCNKCHSKLTMFCRNDVKLSRLEALPEEETIALFNRSASLQTLLLDVETLFKQYEVAERFYEHGGKYLPLSVWAMKGFDADKIKTGSLAVDIEDHPVVGPCYRVAILEKGKRGATGTKEQHDNRPSATAMKRFARTVDDRPSSMPDSMPGSSTDHMPVPPAVANLANLAIAASGSDSSESKSSSKSRSKSSGSETESSESKKKKSKKSKKSRKNKKSSKKTLSNDM